MGTINAEIAQRDAERRIAPRFTHHLDTWVQGHKLRASNFSESGMQIVLEGEERVAIDPTDAIAITIDFPNHPLLAKGRVVYVSEDDDHCLIGVNFTEFLGNGQQTWHHFIDVHEKRALV